jgi:hypothetical protein
MRPKLRHLALAALVTAPLVRAALGAGHIFRDAGVPFSVSGKGEAKVAWVDGAWWGVFASASGSDLFRLQGTTWVQESTPGSHLTNDPAARADVLFTGSELLVLENETVNGVTELKLYDFVYVRPGFRLRGGYPVVVVSNSSTDRLSDDVHTLALDSHQRLWACYRTGELTVGVKASSGLGPSGWLSWKPAVTFGNLNNGVAENLSNASIVATGSGADAKIGVLWADQGAPPANAYRFRYRLDSASSFTIADWSPEEVAYTNGSELVANDQIMTVGFEGSIYAVAKTDTTASTSTVGMDRFVLLVRDPLGNWTKTTVDRIQTNFDPATRPQIVLDHEHRKLYVFWHRSGVVGKVSSLAAPEFLSQPLVSFIDPSGSEKHWDSQTTHQLVDSRTGLLVVADDNDAGFQYWNLLGLGTPASDQPVPVLSTISVAPAIASVDTGAQVQLAASALDQNGAPFATTPKWTADGGGIDQTGLFTAGHATGVFGVAATDSETGHGTVFVGSQPLVASLVVSPDPVEVLVGDSVQLVASGRTPSGDAIAIVGTTTWDVVSGTGSVTSAGVFQAPGSEGLATVVARAQGLTAFGSIQIITVPPPPPPGGSSGGSSGGSGGSGGGSGGASPPPAVLPLARVVVSPGTASVVAGGTASFSAQGFDALGRSVAFSPSWSTSGGKVSSTGAFTAGKQAGRFLVTASGAGVSGSATVTVSAADPPAAFASSGGSGGGGGGGCAVDGGARGSPLALVPFAVLALVVARSRLTPRFDRRARTPAATT